MKEEIKGEDVKKLNFYGGVYAALLLLAVLLVIPLLNYFGGLGIVINVCIWIVLFYFAIKIEKIKKKNNIQTFKEIVAFTEGKHLDEIEKQNEAIKRPYQVFLAVVGSSILAFLVLILLGKLFEVF